MSCRFIEREEDFPMTKKRLAFIGTGGLFHRPFL
jgi:hypothetical protein